MTDILIRRSGPADAEAFVRILSSPRVVWGLLQIPYPSVDEWRKRLEPQSDLYSLVAVADNDVVGQISLHLNSTRPRRKHVASMGMMVRDDWQGKGIGNRLMQAALDLADKWLNITRIELEVYTDNEPAVHLYKKFGFEIEGTLRRHAFRDGEYVDSYFMARLREP